MTAKYNRIPMIQANQANIIAINEILSEMAELKDCKTIANIISDIEQVSTNQNSIKIN